jgi:alpha-L-fucosidase
VSPFGEEFGEYSAKGGKDVRGQKLFLANNEWRATTKPGKLYLTFFSEPRAPFEIPAMKNKITRAYRLADKAPIALKTDNGKTTFDMPRPMLDPMATVVVVEFEGDKVQR